MNTVKHRQQCVSAYKIANGCSVCGYNRHPSALCFDHMDKTNKSEHVKNGYSKRSSAGGMFRLYAKKHTIQELIDEIQKCRILCHNCHMEQTHHKIKLVSPGVFQKCFRAMKRYIFLNGMSIEVLISKLER